MGWNNNFQQVNPLEIKYVRIISDIPLNYINFVEAFYISYYSPERNFIQY
jgi:hypothetical protein